jgi:lipopolysaccharide transport system ATP-binding protein
MSDIVIKAENLGKKYVIGHQAKRGGYTALRDVMMQNARNLWNKTKDLAKGKPIIQGDTLEEVWALKDVSFEIRRGEAVGIIGRNGAGKSTLLKVLSRITEPSAGRVTIRGRVASLLEVGTGFHPELTGRENIYLNGTILGMTRAEIKRKFDEIVAFAEVEKFLDTPVKRYSSGMYVRLAFAVAANLEPEILVVDEVLAVGDAAFQKKCLGKMGQVTRSGRTVLFVSHNMQAIKTLCDQAMLLHQGQNCGVGNVEHIIGEYMSSVGADGAEKLWDGVDDAPGDDTIRLNAIRVMDQEGNLKTEFRSSEVVLVELETNIMQLNSALTIGFDLTTSDGIVISRAYQNDLAPERQPKLKIGSNRLRCVIPSGLLNAGRYLIAPRISLHCQKWIVNSDPCVSLNIRLDHGESPFWTIIGYQATRPGVIAPIWEWECY